MLIELTDVFDNPLFINTEFVMAILAGREGAPGCSIWTSDGDACFVQEGAQAVADLVREAKRLEQEKS